MIHPFHSTAAFFEEKYQREADPWNFAKSEYELRRYEAILKALGGDRYRSAFEPGCSVGVLTEGLAPVCDKFLASDFSATAVEAAQKRCQRFPHVRIICQGLEETESFADFDLVVLSEIGYYFKATQWDQLSRRIVSEMPQRATLVAAHWTGHSADHEMSGDSVHDTLLANPHLTLQLSERHVGFRLERWQRS